MSCKMERRVLPESSAAGTIEASYGSWAIVEWVEVWEWRTRRMRIQMVDRSPAMPIGETSCVPGKGIEEACGWMMIGSVTVVAPLSTRRLHARAEEA